MIAEPSPLFDRVRQHLGAVYELEDEALDQLALDLIAIMRLDIASENPQRYVNHWSQRDAIIISYGSSLVREGEKPLVTLKRFLDQYTEGRITGVHILPFYPWSSDDGFAVIDYRAVDEALGNWDDILAIGGKYDLMADLVINHVSAESAWFQNFIAGKDPGRDYFVVLDPDTDLSAVVRPRTSPLLKAVETASGTQSVWCTFSHDQVDIDFRNPQVLKEMVGVIRHYLDQGVRIFRLDAVAFLWKVPGTSCLNLEQTHELVRLIRTLVERARADAMLITETNIPNQENLSYFGNANEAHCVYNFSLPPLLVNTLVTGDCTYLKQWLMSMPPSQNGTAYFNFIASHDGIGLRPAEGLLSEEEIDTLIRTMGQFGGRISYRGLDGGGQKPYEINIALIDALQGTTDGPDELGLQRFVCAHAIMFGLEGIPGIYIHSLLGTRNDYDRLERTGLNRAINRHQWDVQDLQAQLADENSSHAQVFGALMELLALRSRQAAFHPNATQFTLHLGSALFGFWRQSSDRRQSIFCVSNITANWQILNLSDINLIESERWQDLITGEHFATRVDQVELAPYQTVWVSNYRDYQTPL